MCSIYVFMQVPVRQGCGVTILGLSPEAEALAQEHGTTYDELAEAIADRWVTRSPVCACFEIQVYTDDAAADLAELIDDESEMSTLSEEDHVKLREMIGL